MIKKCDVCESAPPEMYMEREMMMGGPGYEEKLVRCCCTRACMIEDLIDEHVGLWGMRGEKLVEHLVDYHGVEERELEEYSQEQEERQKEWRRNQRDLGAKKREKRKSRSKVAAKSRKKNRKKK